jgi:hypothetical protein
LAWLNHVEEDASANSPVLKSGCLAVLAVHSAEDTPPALAPDRNPATDPGPFRWASNSRESAGNGQPGEAWPAALSRVQKTLERVRALAMPCSLKLMGHQPFGAILSSRAAQRNGRNPFSPRAGFPPAACFS